MAFPVVQYLAASGNDTHSGAGPATPVTGSNAFSGDGAGAGTQTEIDLSGDTPDLSGIATDGSEVIFIATVAGDRKLFKITAVNDTTDIVTVEVAPDTAISSGGGVKAWAIGGKRKTLVADTSNADWLDFRAAWTIEFDAGTYQLGGLEIDNLNGDLATGAQVWRAKAGAASVPIINHASGAGNFRLVNIVGTGDQTTTVLNWRIEGLHFRNEVAWGGGQALRSSFGAPASLIVHLIDCKIEHSGGLANAIEFNVPFAFVCDNVEIVSNSAPVIAWISGRVNVTFTGGWIHTTATSGACMVIGGTGLTGWSFSKTIVSGPNSGTGIGIEFDVADMIVTCENLTFYGFGGDAIKTLTAAGNTGIVSLKNTLFEDIGGIAMNAFTRGHIRESYSAFRNITSGNRNNVNVGAGSVSLTADSMTDPANGDFSLNDTAGGGADCRAAGFPGATLAGLTTGNIDIGAVQHADPAGGGGTVVISRPRRIM